MVRSGFDEQRCKAANAAERYVTLNIFVGNLSYSTSETTLEDLFGEYGDVVRVKIVTDRDTGRPRGFGFVEMATEAEGKAAIKALNEVTVDGRPIQVNEARPRENRSGPRMDRGGDRMDRGGDRMDRGDRGGDRGHRMDRGRDRW